MEALETSREVMSQALLFQKHDLKSRVQSFEDDWTLACVNHQAQVKRARLWILAPARDVGFLVRLGRVLSITFWSVYLVVQAGQTGTVGICDGLLILGEALNILHAAVWYTKGIVAQCRHMYVSV
jgi:hypothetical protein